MIYRNLVQTAVSMLIKTIGTVFLSFALCLCSLAAFADIKGPITLSAPNLGTAEAISFAFGVELDEAVEIGTGRERVRPTVSAMTVERFTDGNSPYYLLAALRGQRLSEVVIIRGSLTLTLRNATVAGYKVESAAMAEIRNRYRKTRTPQIETISFIYEEIKYNIVDDSGAEHEIEFDIAAGV